MNAALGIQGWYMFRLLAITFISFCSVVPFLMVFHRFLELDDDVAGYISFFLAWIITPAILLRIWKVPPYFEALPVDIDDPIMQEQINRAKNEFGIFISGLKDGKLESFIKFPYEIEGNTEHIWGVAHSIKGEAVIASLASDPVGETPEELLERLDVPFDDIEDWMLQDSKGLNQGGYTLLAMAKIYERDFGKLPKRYAKELEPFVDIKWNKNA
ncbi:DUF2314 domain-containing protein [Marinobacterium mangrovicola]|uniref:Uncharacterized protein YegJ (DUF2314 family) n=1 Tax=Marinobacterium mangrovicola TaxID=1476959 RepID=A0A4V6NCV8_9GAMM|nr:DUF2314 domain-containing protein [Marinobacterium mangrovicola]TCK02586.1 uncharacterized protein YegJ (DUF2314 family) [Marinobacterium mangrovicola]